MVTAPRFTSHSGHTQQADGVLLVDANGNEVAPLSDTQLRASAVPVTQPALSAGTDRSGSIATGGTAQQLAAANAARKGLRIQNISAEVMWVNQTGGTAAAAGAGSFKIAVDGTFEITTNQAVSIVAATLGSKFSATEI